MCQNFLDGLLLSKSTGNIWYILKLEISGNALISKLMKTWFPANSAEKAWNTFAWFGDVRAASPMKISSSVHNWRYCSSLQKINLIEYTIGILFLSAWKLDVLTNGCMHHRYRYYICLLVRSHRRDGVTGAVRPWAIYTKGHSLSSMLGHDCWMLLAP